MKAILLIIFVISGYVSFGQCNGFQEGNCEVPFDWEYVYNSQSMETGIFPGQAFRIKAVLYEGSDYYLGFCKQKEASNLQFKIIIEDQTFDHNDATEENENLHYFELSMQKTVMVIIEVKLNRTQNISYNTNDLKCVSIIIGDRQIDE